MYQSIATIANIDDLIDIGMVVEITYSKLFQIPTIGVRTDSRSPFGNISDTTTINPFPVQQCDIYIKAKTPADDLKQVNQTIKSLFLKIDKELDQLLQKTKQSETKQNPILSHLVKGANILFNGIKDRQTVESIKEIVNRFTNNKDFLMKYSPKLINLSACDQIEDITDFSADSK